MRSEKGVYGRAMRDSKDEMRSTRKLKYRERNVSVRMATFIEHSSIMALCQHYANMYICALYTIMYILYNAVFTILHVRKPVVDCSRGWEAIEGIIREQGIT